MLSRTCRSNLVEYDQNHFPKKIWAHYLQRLASTVVWSSPTNWIREDVIFFSQHGPLPAYLKRFHLSDSDYCSCGGIGTALHYATECIYTVSWHMRKPSPNFEQEWLKRVANNLVSRHKIRGIVKFMSGNRDLFRPPLPSTFQRAELKSSITGHSPSPSEKKGITTSKEKKTITN
ncbi:hypothetical protein AVEN_83615-1 [Araneus ventricosus]|uniref:Uncharacterized protein n=1 Tax=Araneus ventricosus TaxID=182803 RepID=A0A4Y2T5C4_ARAVE|nr:hypothetical protein AVEN_17996-1 [Araneus ventricosus]GBN95767.1 hypothetical protein AVEN_83615-1 [Araneus ventricosus]